MKAFVRNASVAEEAEGRVFVSNEDFVACYPSAIQECRDDFLKLFSGALWVEKRIENVLYQRLIDVCWSAEEYSNTAPIVLRDGWVIWLDGGHTPALSILYGLVSSDKNWIYDKNELRLLTEGHAWYISTSMPSRPQLSRNYKPTKADTDIFATFTPMYID